MRVEAKTFPTASFIRESNAIFRRLSLTAQTTEISIFQIANIRRWFAVMFSCRGITAPNIQQEFHSDEATLWILHNIQNQTSHHKERDLRSSNTLSSRLFRDSSVYLALKPTLLRIIHLSCKCSFHLTGGLLITLQQSSTIDICHTACAKMALSSYP